MSDYTGRTQAESYWEHGTQPGEWLVIKDTPNASSGKSLFALIAKREHPVMTARRTQLDINILGLEGGQPYVDKRLSRFPGEADIMFNGGTTRGGNAITGRKKQAHSIPYLARVAEKLNQYIFGGGVKRENADPAVLADITRGGQSVQQFMKDVGRQLTATKWCWIGVDMPEVNASTLTVAQKEAAKVRPYWQLYEANQVVDWCYSATGVLLWVLTEGYQYFGNDPRKEGEQRKVRRLWEAPTEAGGKTKLTTFIFNVGKDSGTIQFAIQRELPYSVVPFVAAGTIDSKPCLFDSLESINRTLLDLNSCSRQNYFESVFPMRYFPASMKAALEESKQFANINEAMSTAIGLHFACFVENGEVVPGIVAPNASDMGAVRTECDSLKYEFVETAGLMVRKNTKQVESAESKEWDNLDMTQGLRDRAQELQEAESKAVAMSKTIDSEFKEWAPVYPTEFDVRDLESDMRSLVMMGNVTLPPELSKIILRKFVDILDRMGHKLTEDERKGALEAIETFVVNESAGMVPAPDGQDEDENEVVKTKGGTAA